MQKVRYLNTFIGHWDALVGVDTVHSFFFAYTVPCGQSKQPFVLSHNRNKMCYKMCSQNSQTKRIFYFVRNGDCCVKHFGLFPDNCLLKHSFSVFFSDELFKTRLLLFMNESMLLTFLILNSFPCYGKRTFVLKRTHLSLISFKTDLFSWYLRTCNSIPMKAMKH